MRKLLLTLSLAAILGTTNTAYAQRHRHNPQTLAQATAVDTAGITAFSDTASTANNVTAAGNNDKTSGSTPDDTDRFDKVNDPFTLIGYLPGIGTGGTIIAIFAVITGMLIACSPFIFAGTIIYIHTKNKNKRYEIIGRAIDKGYEIPQELLRPYGNTNEAMWRKGIQNICIGVGLMFLFGLMGAQPLVGIGCLVALYGVGQAVISKTSKSGNDTGRRDDDNKEGGIN